MHTSVKYLSFILFSTVLTACGGSSDGDSANNANLPGNGSGLPDGGDDNEELRWVNYEEARNFCGGDYESGVAITQKVVAAEEDDDRYLWDSSAASAATLTSHIGDHCVDGGLTSLTIHSDDSMVIIRERVATAIIEGDDVSVYFYGGVGSLTMNGNDALVYTTEVAHLESNDSFSSANLVYKINGSRHAPQIYGGVGEYTGN